MLNVLVAAGIVYAVVAASAATLDPSLIDECGQWTVSAGRRTVSAEGWSTGGAPGRSIAFTSPLARPR